MDDRDVPTADRSTDEPFAEKAHHGSEGSTADTCPDSLIVASNRQPYRHEYDQTEDRSSDSQLDADGQSPVSSARSISVDEPSGGLTAGLDPVLCRSNGTWIAWGDGDADKAVTDSSDCVAVPPEEESYTLRRLWLSDEAVNSYYYGYSNRVLWPLCHGFVDLMSHRPEDFEWYRRVNSTFATAVTEHATTDSVIWLQDYHLGLAPRMIRDRVPPSVTLAHFWHIPWPSPRTFDHCPHTHELLEGLLGNDLLGFHIDQYADQFLDCVEQFLPRAVVDRTSRRVEYDGSTTRVYASAMGIDATSYAEKAHETDREQWLSLCSKYDIPHNSVIGLGVDRLDYTKGIPQRFDALETFFERYPQWHGQFTFVQKATPSRTDIPAYERLGETVRQQADHINERFGTDDWQPIVYTEDVLPQEDLCSLYRNADVMVVSSAIDGMNLVAQEYLAASVDGNGALLLSDRTGAHERFGSSSYTIFPDQPDQFAATLEDALTTPEHELRRRMSDLRTRVFDTDLDTWMQGQFERIQSVHEATGVSETPRNEQSSPAP